MSETTSAAAHCRQCGRPIVFRRTEAGRYQPVDPETGEVHFGTCPARRRSALTAGLSDDECHACHSRHTETLPGSGPHYARLRCLDCNAFRWLPQPRRDLEAGDGRT